MTKPNGGTNGLDRELLFARGHILTGQSDGRQREREREEKEEQPRIWRRGNKRDFTVRMTKQTGH